MITLIGAGKQPIVLDSRQPWHFARYVSVTIGNRTRTAIGATSEKLARRFAAFAGVPYHDHVYQEQWEQLWEMESWMSQK